MAKAKGVLNSGQLSLLFSQLKHYEAAGLPVSQAISALAISEGKLKKPLTLMGFYISKGNSISEAGQKAGVFNETQKTLVHAGETSGRLAMVYSHLYAYYEGLNKRNKKIWSRLTFPILVLALALFVQPLPALINGTISGLGYLQLSVGSLLKIGFGVYLLIKLPNMLAYLGVETAWHRLQLRIPFVAVWITKRQLNAFFNMLAIMLESGLSFETALPKAIAIINNGVLRQQLGLALPALGSGASVSDTLRRSPLINSTMLQIIHSGEQSGKLAESIHHFSQLETQTIALQEEALAEWLPRLVYALIAAWMAYGLIGFSLSSHVPADL